MSRVTPDPADPVDRLIGKIYDCAVDPALWAATLTGIRDAVGGAFAHIGYIGHSGGAVGAMSTRLRWHSPWDTSHFDALAAKMHMVPGIQTMILEDIDVPWLQSAQMPEETFRQSEFYRDWAAPQGLRDCCNISLFQRPNAMGMLTVTTPATREPLTGRDAAFLARLSPHIRRALSIAETVDSGRLDQQIYRRILDTLRTPTILLGAGGVIRYANAAAEKLLSESLFVGSFGGKLISSRRETARALASAIERAIAGDAAAGLSGIGVPLFDPDGNRAALYLLPVGGAARQDLGEALAAAFISLSPGYQPADLEALRTVFGLTIAEARVAARLGHGEKPAEIASALDVSVGTVRSQVKAIFEKTGVNSNVGLTALLNGLIPPAGQSPPTD